MSEHITGTVRAQVEARIIDLSLGGALLHLPAALEVGSITDFHLPLDDGGVWVQAEVRRCSPTGNGYEVGLEFVGVHPHDEHRLRAYLAQRH